jgi:hypothetical protein
VAILGFLTLTEELGDKEVAVVARRIDVVKILGSAGEGKRQGAQDGGQEQVKSLFFVWCCNLYGFQPTRVCGHLHCD